MPDAFRLGAKHAAKLIERGELSAEALLASCRERIAQREPEVKAWTYLRSDAGRFSLGSEARRQIDRARRAQRRGAPCKLPRAHRPARAGGEGLDLPQI